MPRTLLDIFGNSYLAIGAGVGAVMTALSINVLFCIWFERKVSAWVQRRMGPMEVGFHGALQTVNDMIKLLGKQLLYFQTVICRSILLFLCPRSRELFYRW